MLSKKFKPPSPHILDEYIYIYSQYRKFFWTVLFTVPPQAFILYFKYTYQLTTLLASKTSNVEVAKVTNVSTWIYVCETNQLSKLGSVGILTMIKLVRFKTYSPEPGTVKTFWNIIYTSHKL